ncbi:MAG: histidine kinase N-terminal 7TM domain-containing protein [Halolamina sp.]
MGWSIGVYGGVSLAAGALSALLAVVAFRNRSRRAAVPFALLMVALSARSLIYGVQLGYDTLAGQIRWVPGELVLGGAIAALWIAFALRYAGAANRVSSRTYGLLTIEPVVFGALVLTNPAHGLVWRDAALNTGSGVTVIDLVYGVGFYVHVAYTYLVVVAGIVLIARVRVVASEINRRQATTILVGAVVPLVGSVLTVLELTPVSGLDLTPFAFVVSGLMMTLGLFRYDLLDIASVARREWIDDLGDGVLVLDDDGRTITANDTARTVLDPTPTSEVRATDSLPGGSLAAADGTVLEATIDGARRVYDVVHAPVTDHRDDAVGHLVGLRDVTDRHNYEQRLEVANRVLRHNFRNEMNVVLGNAQRLRETLDDDPGADALIDRIETHATRVVELNEEIQEVADTLEHDSEQTVDLVEVVREAVAAVERRYPAATVRTQLPPADAGSGVVVVDREALSTAVENVVENGVEHNDDPAPTVAVSVDAEDDDCLTVRVVDDGPGIPAAEREVLLDGRETALKHGSGLRLWLVHWVVAASGGEVHFENVGGAGRADGGTQSSSEDGSTVVLRFRRDAL